MIIYEDENILIVNKPAGLIIHQPKRYKPIPKRNKRPKTLVDWLLKKYPEIKNVGEDPKRPGIVHRLDRDTSGLLLIAKNQNAYQFLKEQFQKRNIKKGYLALVEGELKDKKGTITLAIGRNPKTPVKKLAHEKARGKLRRAVTKYKQLQKFSNEKTYTLLEVRPETGRTHQIRVHLKAIGHPVVCDKLYGKEPPHCPFGLKRQFLHASFLEFISPTGSRIRVEAEIPNELKSVLNSLEKYDKC
jgi:23S rRNA pseudouridine1911/1915/1917 synthase